MRTTITGFPRIGAHRELKFAVEKYFRNEIQEKELLEIAHQLKLKNWHFLKNQDIDDIPSNDFSFYDTTLDTAVLLNIIPTEINEIKLSSLDRYFALARGYQGEKGDIKALTMKKWFNTNYHYLVPEFTPATRPKLVGEKLFSEYLEAKAAGFDTRPVILGPYTLLKVARFHEGAKPTDFHEELITAYGEILTKLTKLGAKKIQIDEPALVLDTTKNDWQNFVQLYTPLLKENPLLSVTLQTYFGDVRDIYPELCQLPFSAIGLDFIEGKETTRLINEYGFPKDKELIAGVINGKNIWKNQYQTTLELLSALPIDSKQLTLSTSCSLLHAPYTVNSETKLAENKRQYLAFAHEKVIELTELKQIFLKENLELLTQNQQLFEQPRVTANLKVAETISQLKTSDFNRPQSLDERRVIQKTALQLPILPTTTIGSFPQTRVVKQQRAKFRKEEVSESEYVAFVHQQIKECIQWQEDAGFDVLVHGEFERNDMVEYFGQHLSGYLFTENGWVQSYGTRCVKPPIVWEDIVRESPITVKWSTYAQSLTNKLVKGMLTGPVTILNWSFPREDLSLENTTLQLALAIQQEVLDLEASGIKIIQIDEAALREKLPLRRSDWYSDYLDWAIPAFRLVHSQVSAETQIHTHMCYSQFSDIIDAIEGLDADVISFEAARSDLDILDTLQDHQFQLQVGPGVYDIHSPRIPSVIEIKQTLEQIIDKVAVEKVWVNPDCGLKTRGISETRSSLNNLIEARRQVKEGLVHENVRII